MKDNMEDIHDRMFWLVPTDGDTSKAVNICDIDNWDLKRIIDRMHSAWDKSWVPIYVQRWTCKASDKKEISELSYKDFNDLEDYIKEVVNNRMNIKRTCPSCNHASMKHGNPICVICHDRDDVLFWLTDNWHNRVNGTTLTTLTIGGLEEDADNCPGFKNCHVWE
jgi:hypothetical protein